MAGLRSRSLSQPLISRDCNRWMPGVAGGTEAGATESGQEAKPEKPAGSHSVQRLKSLDGMCCRKHRGRRHRVRSRSHAGQSCRPDRARPGRLRSAQRLGRASAEAPHAHLPRQVRRCLCPDLSAAFRTFTPLLRSNLSRLA